jgi:soluble lytic murein transglycosylase-like protein
MQVLPTTRDLIVRARGLQTGDLKDVAVNMAFGQEYIRWMRQHPATGGRLPKIVASYNCRATGDRALAGQRPGRSPAMDRVHAFLGDALLRAGVMRNLWVYQGFDNAPTPTLTELAQHKWPTFPGPR